MMNYLFIYDFFFLQIIFLLDFGFQISYLILRCFRFFNIYVEMFLCIIKIVDLIWKLKGVIFSGGMLLYFLLQVDFEFEVEI